jgi:hypothetical protein
MKYDITDVIADLVLQADPELGSRLEYQDEALRETKCVNPVVGRWIDANDVKYLLSTLDLDDKDFAAKFPTMEHITRPERQKIMTTIEAHFEQCQHCSLKRGYDLELDMHIKQACQQNSSTLLQLLEEDEADLSEEGEHQIMELKSARSADQ